MKKQFNLLLMAALVCGLSLSVTSCKSDDDDNGGDESFATLTIDSDLLSHGIETDIQSAVIEVPVKADGSWTATLRNLQGDKKIPDWCKVLDWQVTYNGNNTLKLAIDENLTKVGRKCELVIGNGGDEYKHITVYQNYTFNGQDPSNGSGMAFSDKGLGTGIDYNYVLNVKGKGDKAEGTGSKPKFDPTMVHGLNNIFNIKRIQELQTNGKLSHSAYVEAKIPLADLQAALLDSSVVQHKEIDLGITLSVSFGIIEFSAGAHYNSQKDEARAHVDYTIVRYAPMYNVYLAPEELSVYAQKNRKLVKDDQNKAYADIDDLIEYYNTQNKRKIKRGRLSEDDLDEDGLTEEQAAEIEAMEDAIPKTFDYAGIFSAGFGNRYNELYNAIVREKLRGHEIDTAAANLSLRALDNAFGPFYIAGGNFGGTMVVHCLVDTMKQEGFAKFKGELGGEGMGIFKVNGTFEYTEKGYNAMKDVNPTFYIVGGNANTVADDLLAIFASGRPNDIPKIGQILKGWLESMDTSDEEAGVPSEASPISFIIQPIWMLFSEPEIQQYVQDWFMTEYDGRGIDGWHSLMSGGINPGADGLLNSESQFWKNHVNKKKK